ncbi:MAG: DUF2961 domain-containing protein [Pirellulales bacterium]|nr:DUF2961 domain-containing protein [Pirellulales bacterium]
MHHRILFSSLIFVLPAVVVLIGQGLAAEEAPTPEAFSGLDVHLGNLYRLSPAQTRSISAENFTGEKGKGGMAIANNDPATQGWKVSPAVGIGAKSTFTLAEIDGPGAIQQIWMTPAPLEKMRLAVIRFYWDGETEPSVEVPLADFFACGWCRYCPIRSLAVCVNPGSAFNCYWNMPFRKKAKITVENLDDADMWLYYQINYTLTEVPADAAYFHAQFRRRPDMPEKTVFTILDGVKGRGQYVGTYLAWEVNRPGWWGEGEVKFYLDGDQKFPTICGTGTEDYFGGSYDFKNSETGLYEPFTTPYSGMCQVIPPDRIYIPPQRFGLYRWHIPDPVRFEKDLRVTIQSLGWMREGKRIPMKNDIASTAYWYQTEPHAKFPPLPGKEQLQILPLKQESADADQKVK